MESSTQYTYSVFADIAERCRGAMGWFYGSKLLLVMNDEADYLWQKPQRAMLMIEGQCQI
ncbi:hypothetical protein DXX93_09900 [Thalassotalea euphylliae]|uniref:Transposase DDE domain-containing protein n=1 Tax=Thalassotalea euphylliae TaxID=1655234 RepID=A0A3E0TQR1_9GAMM|nr:hypothetical protein DXX93_09900 [Thalassotalea euphylliae]